MIERTVIIVGPGGVGKSPLDALFKDNITRIEPYRLRSKGPRDSNDKLYAHPKLRNELHQVLFTLEEQLQQVPCDLEHIEWFPKGKVLFFTVRRRDWQCLILHGLQGSIAKAEIYAPLLPTLLSTPDISSLLGETEILVLNPAPQSLTLMQNWQDLKEKTRGNCSLRSDSPDSVEERVASIDGEAPIWNELIEKRGATEYVGWEFPEHLYKQNPSDVSLVERQKNILIKARERLLAGNPRLSIFLKSLEEIRQIKEPIVK